MSVMHHPEIAKYHKETAVYKCGLCGEDKRGHGCLVKQQQRTDAWAEMTEVAMSPTNQPLPKIPSLAAVPVVDVSSSSTAAVMVETAADVSSQHASSPVQGLNPVSPSLNAAGSHAQQGAQPTPFVHSPKTVQMSAQMWRALHEFINECPPGAITVALLSNLEMLKVARLASRDINLEHTLTIGGGCQILMYVIKMRKAADDKREASQDQHWLHREDEEKQSAWQQEWSQQEKVWEQQSQQMRKQLAERAL